MKEGDFRELRNRRGNMDDFLTGRIDFQSLEVEVDKI